ncbi:PTS system cellobiose-specific component IIC [Spiroplasma citri]|nr:PTS transporter subunit EIIC [Spiroplasma citri]APE75282.1 PTS system cellobiose-specific component IIC [Spiroplasma citri]WFG97876.1 PTS transporter subunit EIIC [Spiroplasma citri]
MFIAIIIAIIVVFLITFLWWFGIHGGSLVQSVTRPFRIIALDENQNALQNGNLIQNDFVEPFFQWFAQYGGAGSTIGLVIIGSIIAKSKLVKTTTRTSLIPSIFNINEPILFGLPILVNPYMWVPFVFSPVAGAIVGFGAQKAMGINWVLHPFHGHFRAQLVHTLPQGDKMTSDYY